MTLAEDQDDYDLATRMGTPSSFGIDHSVNPGMSANAGKLGVVWGPHLCQSS